MFKLESNTKRIDSVFVVILFLLFAITALTLVIIGVKQYRVTADSMNYNYEVRTAVSYLREKVRQNDDSSSIAITEIDGTAAILQENVVGDYTYCTYIYFYEGYLCELYVQSGSQFSLSNGQQIIEIGGLSLSQVSNTLISATITDTDGGTTEVCLSVKSTD